MKRCPDRRVGAGLAVIAMAIWALAPRWTAAALPLLIVAACPLMMRGRGSSPVPATGATAQAGGQVVQLRRQLADQANTQMAPPADRAATAHPSGSPRSG